MKDRAKSSGSDRRAQRRVAPGSADWGRAALMAVLAGAAIWARAPAARAQEIEVAVDPRVELVAVLFHMGGRDEYNMTRVPRWLAAVDSHFARWADHPAAIMTERLAGKYGVGFFVPMNLAVHLTDPPELAERTPFATTPSLHRTWTTYPDTTRAYLALVRDFARAAQFEEFLVENAALVDSTETRLSRLVAEIDVSWFSDFWGMQPPSDFILVPGLVNGAASYGVDYEGPAGRSELYAIVGVTDVDSAGFPAFDAEDVRTIVHEFNHSYANPLIEERLDDFRPFGDSLYAPVAERMRRQGYGSWESVLYESLVRAAVVRYLAHRAGGPAAVQELERQTDQGFVWMEALDELLDEYERQRDTYPTLRHFMDRVVRFFQGLVPVLPDQLGG